MAKHPRWLETTLATLGACALAASGVSAAKPSNLPRAMVFLPATGPPPLRFLATHATARLVLAPLGRSSNKTRSSEENSRTNASVTSALGAPTNSPGSSATATRPTAESTPAREGPLLPAMPLPTGLGAPPDGALDPRMILEYLTPVSTNSTNHASRLWPVFVPPTGIQPMRSSEAAFETR